MKSSASESKPFQSRSKGEISGRARRKERLSRSNLKQAFLSDSGDELFMYLIQCIRFGSWKVRRLNRVQGYFINLIGPFFLYTGWETKSLSLNPVLKFMAYLL